MNLSLRNTPLAFPVVALAVIGVCFFITTLPAFSQNPIPLSFGITFDLTISIPILYYFLVVRKHKVSPFTLIPVFGASMALASWILPPAHHTYLNIIGRLTVFAELASVILIVIKIRSLATAYQKVDFFVPDFMVKIQGAFEQVFGTARVVAIVVTEITLFYYTFLIWNKVKEIDSQYKTFTYHQNSGYAGIWGALGFMVILETFVVHILLESWSPLGAWVLTGLSIYSLIFFIADYKAVLRRPIIVTDKQLYLRIGLRWRVLIPLAEIASIEKPAMSEEFKDKNLLKATLIGEPDLIINLKKEIEVKGMYGMSKKVNRIAIQTDDKEEFKKAITIG